METQRTLESVKNYYGRVLKSKQDLQTSACCSAEAIPAALRPLLKDIHPEVQERFYGCGSPFPPALEGRTVLDLGCGTGRDCFLLSRLVGPEGAVIGVDMTEEQLAVARKHEEYHRERYGYGKSNVSFRHGYIEDLKAADIADESVDVVISNCVLNLSPDKKRVFSEILRVLKPGGELYFSDVFAGKRVPAPLRQDPLLLGECLGGALYVEDFRRLMLEVGVPDYRVVSRSPITLTSPEVVAKAGRIDFHSFTIRAFKLADLEDRCEDYGQVGVYLGTLPDSPHFFTLDDHHVFETGRPMLICGTTASMLSHTRYASHFEVRGDRSVHYGLFDCAPVLTGAAKPMGACC